MSGDGTEARPTLTVALLAEALRAALILIEKHEKQIAELRAAVASLNDKERGLRELVRGREQVEREMGHGL